MGGSVGMTLYIVNPKQIAPLPVCIRLGLAHAARVCAIFLKIITKSSHHYLDPAVKYPMGKDVYESAHNPMDSSRRIRCQRASRAHFWFCQLFWLPRVVHAVKQKQLANKNSLLLNQHLCRLNRYIRANTNHFELGRGAIPVPIQHTAKRYWGR